MEPFLLMESSKMLKMDYFTIIRKEKLSAKEDKTIRIFPFEKRFRKIEKSICSSFPCVPHIGSWGKYSALSVITSLSVYVCLFSLAYDWKKYKLGGAFNVFLLFNEKSCLILLSFCLIPD